VLRVGTIRQPAPVSSAPRWSEAQASLVVASAAQGGFATQVFAGLGGRRSVAGQPALAPSVDIDQSGPYLLCPFWTGPAANTQGPVTSAMKKAELEKFRRLLEAKRREIIRRAQQTLDEDMTLDADDLPDEMDLASSEYLQSFTFRLRGREKVFLEKIQKALDKIEEGAFGICEECGGSISLKRLEARPETTLCIRCKEDQERVEKDFG
jgi:DnaK suppressor protein